MKIKMLILTLFTIFLLLFLAGCTSNSRDNNPSDGNNNWLENYTPVHSVGNVTENFWINFPVGGPSAGQSVNHLTWIKDDLEEKPVVFICHKTGCSACTPQADCVKALREIYGEDAVFYDLDLPFSGDYTKDTETKFNEVFYYDANGPPSYIAFTGVFTYVNDSGEVKIGWHTWEGNVEQSVTESWIKDAVYFYNINKQG